MSDPTPKRRGFTRRDLIKSGAAGASALLMSGLGACGRERDPADPGELGTAQRGLVKPRPAEFYTPLGAGRVRCDLCPTQCQLDPGATGRCRVRTNSDGVLLTLAYGNPALVQEDPVERKPYFHVRPGSRALSISTAGCNLSCSFCEVWDMALVSPKDVYAHDLDPEAVVAAAEAAGLAAISYGFGEPVVFFEYLCDVAALARERGLLNLVHTAGYIQPEPLAQMLPLIDAFNVDLKGFDPGFYRDVVGGELDPVLSTLKTISDAAIHTEVTTILIPGLNDDLDELERMCRWIADALGPGTPLHLARFYPLYRLSALPRTPVATLDAARKRALATGLEYVYVAKVTGHVGENTYCAGCGELVVERVGFVIQELRLERGRCQYCGTRVPGIWN